MTQDEVTLRDADMKVSGNLQTICQRHGPMPEMLAWAVPLYTGAFYLMGMLSHLNLAYGACALVVAISGNYSQGRVAAMEGCTQPLRLMRLARKNLKSMQRQSGQKRRHITHAEASALLRRAQFVTYGKSMMAALTLAGAAHAAGMFIEHHARPVPVVRLHHDVTP